MILLGKRPPRTPPKPPVTSRPEYAEMAAPGVVLAAGAVSS